MPLRKRTSLLCNLVCHRSSIGGIMAPLASSTWSSCSQASPNVAATHSAPLRSGWLGTECLWKAGAPRWTAPGCMCGARGTMCLWCCESISIPPSWWRMCPPPCPPMGRSSITMWETGFGRAHLQGKETTTSQALCSPSIIRSLGRNPSPASLIHCTGNLSINGDELWHQTQCCHKWQLNVLLCHNLLILTIHHKPFFLPYVSMDDDIPGIMLAIQMALTRQES